MTSLRFAGELPLIPGLLLALLVAVMAWRFYRRECTQLQPRLRWLLPCLRATAFLLGVLILTGPVLHHRQTVGEPGTVRIYVDGSRSMSLVDRHLAAARKLRIAEQQGWLAEERVDFALLDTADRLQQQQQRWMAVQSATLTDIAPNITRSDIAGSDATDSTNTSSPVNGPETAADIAAEITAELQSARSLSAAAATRSAIDAAQQLLEALPDRETPDGEAARTFGRQLSATVAALRTEFDDDLAARLSGDGGALQTAIDLFDQSSRWQRLQRSLQTGESSLLNELRGSHNVEIVTLAGRDALRQAIPESPTVPTPPELPNTPLTDLTSGVTATQDSGEDSQAGQTAVVLLTDGRHNAGPSPVQTARLMGAQGVAFYPVSFGAATAPGDLVLKSVTHPDTAFVTDTLTGELEIQDTMPAGRPLTVRLRQQDDVVWEQTLTTNGQGARQIPFQLDVQTLLDGADWQTSEVRQHAVPVDLQAEIVATESEAEAENNTAALRVGVITQPSRILLLDGRSRWETRYLRNAFERDSQWHVDVLIAGPGTDTPTLPRGDRDGQFPSSKERLLSYDLVILGEIPTALLNDFEYEWLREFVQVRGGGLVLLDGSRGRLQQQTAEQLLNLFPVEWEPAGGTAPAESMPVALSLTAASRSLPDFLLATADHNEQLWQQLPPPRVVQPVTPLADAETLVEAVYPNDTRRAVLVTRLAGAGRVLYFSADETWRWRYKNADTYHQRFWNQIARYVMPEPFSSSDEFLSLDAGAVTYDPGDTASLRVQLRGPDGRPMSTATVDALLSVDGEVVSTVSLTADPSIPGRYLGTSGELLLAGNYEVRVRASGYSSDALRARASFLVREAQSAELSETSCNERLLQQMAEESGGVYLREDQFQQLPSLLQPLSNGRIIESDTVLWQSYWWFSAILLLLTAEWWLRKRAGLL